MEVSLKIGIKRIVVFMLMVYLSLSQSFAQQVNRDSMKLALLKNKVTMAETKVAAIERKLEIADSLVSVGDSMIMDAHQKLEPLKTERSNHEKNYKSEVKRLKKGLKSKDEDIVDETEDEMDDAEDAYNAQNKLFYNEEKRLTKQIIKGESVATKGEKNKMTLGPKLKIAYEKLEYAKENYESFLESTLNE